MYSIRRIIINPQLKPIRSIYTNTSNSIKQSVTQNKIGIRNASTIELLETIKYKYSYSDKFWALQQLAIKYALPVGFMCALGSTIKYEYNTVKNMKIYNTEHGIENKKQLTVEDFGHSLMCHCLVVGIPTAFKTAFFHVYGIGFIIVSAINYIG
jgi:hypothetical protein